MVRNREAREQAEALAVTSHNRAAAIPLSRLAATPSCHAAMVCDVSGNLVADLDYDRGEHGSRHLVNA